jgi:uncharacterized RDD family membrane protein YckC
MDKYETFWRRVGAAILDSILLFLINWSVSAAVMIFIPFGMGIWAFQGFISASYYILAHAYGGQTMGKMATKVEVLDDSETPITLGQSILRSLPQLLLPMFAVSFSTAGESAAESIATWASVIYGFTGLFSLLNVIVCLSNDKRRALHDFIAGTVVVRTDT